jgi:hypothetical protein
MADSAESQALNGLAVEAFAAYVDGGIGDQPNAAKVAAAFPGAHHLTITVTGATLAADAIDAEQGDPDAVSAADWVRRKLAAGARRPVVYADLETPGYSMREVLADLTALGIARTSVRLWTAHYGQGEHICGPHSCGELPVDADGTQWTDAYHGPAGVVDMSLLADDFFGPPPGWVFTAVRGLVGTHGPHSLRLTWSSPGQPAPEAVHHYQVTVRLAGRDIRGFPVTVPKTGVQESVQWDGVERGTYDQAMVRAVAVGGHASPWASVTFPAQA